MSRGTIHRTVRIEDALWTTAKEKAESEGVSLSEIIRDALRVYVAEGGTVTVVISGGWPAPEVPNCVGVDGRGCEAGWKLTVPRDAPSGWWKSPDVQSIIKAHERTHITQRG